MRCSNPSNVIVTKATVFGIQYILSILGFFNKLIKAVNQTLQINLSSIYKSNGDIQIINC